jgi:cyclophilin family peptidyl-prolyl cis-trans isomerase
MFTVGVIAFVLGCVFLVIYQTKIKGGSKPKLKSASKLRALQEKKRSREDEQLSIESVQAGGVIHLEDVGLRSQSFDVQVTARHLHKRGSVRVPELEADRGGSRVFITLERDDELDINVTVAQPSIEDLGITSNDLHSIRDGHTLTYDGTEFVVAERGHAVFCRDGNELQPEKYEFWEFEGEDGEQYLTLVRWEDGSVEANYSVEVQPSHVTVYSRS